MCMTLHSKSTSLSTFLSSNTDDTINKSASHKRGAGSERESPRNKNTSVGLPHIFV